LFHRYIFFKLDIQEGEKTLCGFVTVVNKKVRLDTNNNTLSVCISAGAHIRKSEVTVAKIKTRF
jgi:hypothetical protein